MKLLTYHSSSEVTAFETRVSLIKAPLQASIDAVICRLFSSAQKPRISIRGNVQHNSCFDAQTKTLHLHIFTFQICWITRWQIGSLKNETYFHSPRSLSVKIWLFKLKSELRIKSSVASQSTLQISQASEWNFPLQETIYVKRLR